MLASAFGAALGLEVLGGGGAQEHQQQEQQAEGEQHEQQLPIALSSRRTQSRALQGGAPQHIVTASRSTRWWNVGCAAAQGFRPSMEDACVLDLELDDHVGVVAVFDGHGGAECAEHCATHLTSALRCTRAWRQGDLPGALTEAFLELDHQLVKCGRAPCSSGTTGTVALLQGPRLVVAGVGDSKAILLRGGRIVPMTVDHRPNSPDEEARIRSAGGFVHQGRVNACLNVSRALGDAQFKQADRPACQQQVSPEPDIREATAAATTDFLLVCSDGVWNSMRETQVLRFVRQRLLAGVPPEVICQQLCQACLEPCRTAYDNITAILVLFTEDSLRDPAGDQGERAGAALVPMARGALCDRPSATGTSSPSAAGSPSPPSCAAACAVLEHASAPDTPGLDASPFRQRPDRASPNLPMLDASPFCLLPERMSPSNAPEAPLTPPAKGQGLQGTPPPSGLPASISISPSITATLAMTTSSPFAVSTLASIGPLSAKPLVMPAAGSAPCAASGAATPATPVTPVSVFATPLSASPPASGPLPAAPPGGKVDGEGGRGLAASPTLARQPTLGVYVESAGQQVASEGQEGRGAGGRGEREAREVEMRGGGDDGGERDGAAVGRPCGAGTECACAPASACPCVVPVASPTFAKMRSPFDQQ